MEEKTFESALKRLEDIVHQLESGDAPLEQSIQLYEEAIKLKSFCARKLNEAQMKVEQITRSIDGEVKTTPFDEESES